MKKTTIGGLAAGAVALGIAGALPVHAHADVVSYYPDTTGYINALIADGINPYPTSRSLQVGTQVCTALHQGVGVSRLIDMLDANTDVPRSFVRNVVIDAHVYLCPNESVNGTGSLSGGTEA